MKLLYKKDVDNKDILVGDEHYQVMMEWEKPYMEALVDKLKPSGDVLEIGFGLGYSADAIQKYDINTHTIIECDPEVLIKLREWAKRQKHKVIIVEGSWQEVLSTIDQRFDSIFMDDYPLDEYPDPEFVRTFHFYFSIIKRNVNKDARFTFFCSNPVTWPCTMWMEWDSEEYNITIPDDVDNTHSQATDNKLYLPLVTFKESSPIFIHPIVIEKFIKGNETKNKYVSYNVLTEEHRSFILDTIKPLLFPIKPLNSENYSGNGMHTHPDLYLNPKLRLFYDRIVEDFKTLVGKEPVIKKSWALWTNGQYVNWHNHQNADFSIVYYIEQHPTIGRATQFEDGSAVTSPQNSLLIFDSKISHSVPSSTIKINRYSIATDVTTK